VHVGALATSVPPVLARLLVIGASDDPFSRQLGAGGSGARAGGPSCSARSLAARPSPPAGPSASHVTRVVRRGPAPAGAGGQRTCTTSPADRRCERPSELRTTRRPRRPPFGLPHEVGAHDRWTRTWRPIVRHDSRYAAARPQRAGRRRRPPTPRTDSPAPQVARRRCPGPPWPIPRAAKTWRSARGARPGFCETLIPAPARRHRPGPAPGSRPGGTASARIPHTLRSPRRRGAPRMLVTGVRHEDVVGPLQAAPAARKCGKGIHDGQGRRAGRARPSGASGCRPQRTETASAARGGVLQAPSSRPPPGTLLVATST